LIITALTLVFLIAGGLVLLYVSLYNRRKKSMLEERQRMAERYAAELIQARVEVQEYTLQTIGAEIHDNVGQILSLTKLTLSSVNFRTPDKAIQKLDDAQALLDNGIRSLRQLSVLLCAENLLTLGLEHAVRTELGWLEKSGRFKASLQESGARREPEPNIALMSFRILQELFNNIMKHAHAGSVVVTFDYGHEYLDILVADDGSGFDVPSARMEARGLGLSNLFRRADIIGARLDIHSMPGHGTQARLIIPYLQTHAHAAR